MSNISKNDKLQFFKKWTLFSTIVIPISYIISLIPIVIIGGAFFGISMNEWGGKTGQSDHLIPV